MRTSGIRNVGVREAIRDFFDLVLSKCSAEFDCVSFLDKTEDAAVTDTTGQ